MKSFNALEWFLIIITTLLAIYGVAFAVLKFCALVKFVFYT